MKRNAVVLLVVAATSVVACKKDNAAGVKSEESGSATPAEVAPPPRASLEAEISKPMAEFRDKFLACKTDQDVADRIDEVTRALKDGKFDTPETRDIKYVAAQLLPLVPLRGVVWRLVPIVEKKNKTVQSLAVTALMAMATGTRIVQPREGSGYGTSAWQALSHYFAYPFKGTGEQKGVGEQFASVQDVQDKLVPDLWAAVNQSIGYLEKLQVTDKSPIVWDNRMVLGRDTFGPNTDSLDRFVALGKPELDLTVAGFYAMRHNLRVFVEYDLDQMPEYARELGLLIGLEEFRSDPTGMSARDRVTALCGASAQACSKHQTLFTRRAKPEDRDQKYEKMTDALADLEKAVNLVAGAWKDAKDKQRDLKYPTYQLLDPAKLVPWERIGDTTIANIQKIIQGQPVRNAVTGEMVTTNIPELYKNPPKDLKAFLPTKFSDAPQRMDVNGFQGVRNYEYGMSTGWNAEAYKAYFPSVKNGDEVPELMRDLSQTWGGWVAFLPVSSVSMVF